MRIRSKTLKSLIPRLRHDGFRARRETGKSLTAQAAEMLALAWGVGKLHPEEYYQYRLYDDRRYNWAEKKRFLGRVWRKGLYYALGSADWGALAFDKLIWGQFFERLGFPVARTIAAYHPFRSLGDISVLRDHAQLEAFFRTGAPYPLFVKPIWGADGKGVAGVAGYEDRSDRLRLESGESVGLTEFVERTIQLGNLGGAATSGCIIQEMLRPHSRIRELCGNRLCTVRMVMILDENEPRLVAKLWKITTGTSMADNYWEEGNLAAPIELDTGEIGTPIAGLGLDIRPVLEHPDTGRRFEGFELPDWNAAKELCVRATTVLPGMPLQSWDVALTDRGPVLMELNTMGSFRLPQLIEERGLYSGEFKAFVERYGFPRLKIRKPGVKRR